MGSSDMSDVSRKGFRGETKGSGWPTGPSRFHAAGTDFAIVWTSFIAIGALVLFAGFDFYQLTQTHTALATAQISATARPPISVWQALAWHLSIASILAFAAIFLAIWRIKRQPETMRFNAIATVICAAPMGIALWDAQGRLRAANPAFRRDMGLNRAHTRAGAPYKRIRQHLREHGHLEIIEDGEQRRRTEYVTKGGACLELNEHPLPFGGFVTILNDCSEKHELGRKLDQAREKHREMEAKLHSEIARAEAASQAKSNFVSQISHEIRTPLNHIIGFADLICHQSYGPIGDKRYANYIDHIRESGELLANSFNEILEFAQLESGEKLLRREIVRINELMLESSKRHMATAKGRNVVLAISQPGDLTIKGDSHCLGRMISNVLDNAVRYTPTGGQVTLAAWEAEDGIVLEITDTGTGISPDRLRSLGQAFVLGEDVFSRNREGAGLGLAISRKIAELSGGTLHIDSTQGLGTTVAISLPRDPAHHAARQKAA